MPSLVQVLSVLVLDFILSLLMTKLSQPVTKEYLRNTASERVLKLQLITESVSSDDNDSDGIPTNHWNGVGLNDGFGNSKILCRGENGIASGNSDVDWESDCSNIGFNL
jgi:hypothetical protein